MRGPIYLHSPVPRDFGSSHPWSPPPKSPRTSTRQQYYPNTTAALCPRTNTRRARAPRCWQACPQPAEESVSKTGKASPGSEQLQPTLPPPTSRLLLLLLFSFQHAIQLALHQQPAHPCLLPDRPEWVRSAVSSTVSCQSVAGKIGSKRSPKSIWKLAACPLHICNKKSALCLCVSPSLLRCSSWPSYCDSGHSISRAERLLGPKGL